MDNEEFGNKIRPDEDLLKRRQPWAVPLAVFSLLALVGVAIWGFYQNRQLKQFEILTTNQYNRAFVDLTDYVDNVEVLLAKSLVTSTPTATSGMLEEVWRQANLAQTNIGQLPIAPPILEKTSNFLTQVGDLAYSLNTKTMNGTALNDKEYEYLKKMHGFAVSLKKSLNGIENQINTGTMYWGSGTNLKTNFKNTSKGSDAQTNQIGNIDKNFQEYPSLIYDGPYSDHMLNTKPLGLKDGMVTVDRAKEIIINLLGRNVVQSIEQLQDNNAATIKTYRFKVLYKNYNADQSAEIDITQQGGQIYWMLRNRDIGKETLKMDDAKKAATAFLDKTGFKDMKDTYYLKNDGTAVITYAYTQDNVIVYPDQVKVKVALDNGEIVGIESKGYLYNHKKRDISTPKLTIDEARKIINNKLKITGQKQAIIPTDFKTEKYCYEFAGTLDDHTFLIYINAMTGKEEDVLMLVNTENGTLTM